MLIKGIIAGAIIGLAIAIFTLCTESGRKKLRQKRIAKQKAREDLLVIGPLMKH